MVLNRMRLCVFVSPQHLGVRLSQVVVGLWSPTISPQDRI